MIEAVGSKVQKLVRTAIGPVRIADLPIGTWRNLTGEEVAALKFDAETQRRRENRP